MKTQEDYYQEYIEQINGMESYMAFLRECVTTPPENELQALARIELTENWYGHFEELAKEAEIVYINFVKQKQEQWQARKHN